MESFQKVFDDPVSDVMRENSEGAQADQARVERELADKIRSARTWFTREVKLLFEFMQDPNAPVMGKAVAVAALLYFIVPVDLIPDFIPVVGYADDAAVIAAAVMHLSSELKNYAAHRELH